MSYEERKSVILDYIEHNLKLCTKLSHDLKNSVKNYRNTKKQLISMMLLLDHIEIIKVNLSNFYKEIEASHSISEEEFKKHYDSLKEVVFYLFFEEDESYKEENFKNLINGLTVKS